MSEDQPSRDRFKVMERKLYRGIMTPSMVATVALGLAMLLPNWESYRTAYWMHAKLTLVLILLAYHLYCGRLLQRFAADQNRHGEIFYRWFNEFPVLILLPVVILVIVRPF